LLLGFGSVVDELTVAVFEIVPAGPFDLATSVIVRLAPLAREANVTVRSLPVPAQTPPPVAAQDTKVTPAGRLSVTTTDCAVLTPLLVTTIEYVTLEPMKTGSGESVLVIERSGGAWFTTKVAGADCTPRPVARI
jgi:hypothetical protein